MSIFGDVVETLFLATKGILPGQGETDETTGSDYISPDSSDDEKAQADSMTEPAFWATDKEWS
jgi:hypothetical protein